MGSGDRGGRGIGRGAGRPPRARRTHRILPAVAGALLLAGCGDRPPSPPPEELLRLRNLGLAYLEENRLEQAAETFGRLADLAPDEPLGHANRGVALLRQDRPEEAVRALELAHRRDRDDPLVRYNLAVAYEARAREEEARELLEGTVRRSPEHVRSLVKLVELQPLDRAGAGGERVRLLRRLVDADPDNLPARLQLVEALLDTDRPREAAPELVALARVVRIPEEADEAWRDAVQAARRGDAVAAAPAARRLQDHLLATPEFQAGFLRLHGPVAGLSGIPLERFAGEPGDRPTSADEAAAFRFVDATEAFGLDAVRIAFPMQGDAGTDPSAAGTVAALHPADGGRPHLLVHARSPTGAAAERGGTGELLLLAVDSDGVREVAREAGLPGGGALHGLAVGDADDDGRPDLLLLGEGRVVLRPGLGDGTFGTPDAPLPAPPSPDAVVLADFDHTGHLDVLVTGPGGTRLLGNVGDGSFRDRTEEAGMDAASAGRTGALLFADVDDDGVLDLFIGRSDGPDELWRNLRGGRFEEVAQESGLEPEFPTGAAALGDLDGDGAPDLILVAADGSGGRVYRNRGDGTFRLDERSAQALASLADVRARAALLLDADNSGHLDLLVVGTREDEEGRGVLLFRNDGTGGLADASQGLPADVTAGIAAVAEDVDGNGALEILLLRPDGRLRLLRNEGAASRHHLRVRLRGLGAGAGRVNRLGIGSTVELKAGDLYQRRTVTGPVTHFGLGAREGADVVRVVWTNGVPQNVFEPAADRTLLEEQVLKGSCPFLYAWIGNGFEFVTDVMWASALGMPVGIMGGSGNRAGERILASPGASMEYARIPPDALVPRGGAYELRLTTELWETAYLDEVKLVAVDHPEGTELLVDETFSPPAPPELRLYAVAERHLPVSATDARGTDLLPHLRARDGRYTPAGLPGPYQGIAEPWELVLDLGPAAAEADDLRLFLQGWIFPSDASINVAAARRRDVTPLPPRLEVPDGRGGWRVAIEDLGFPRGKDKTMVVHLDGRLPPGETRVRIRTNMEIHWDHVFFTARATEAALRADAEGVARMWAAGLGPEDVRLTLLRASAAELRYRGFSRLFRKGGADGPHWFDYDDVSAEPRWRDLEGTYTRYGDVLPLLGAPDSRYAVMNAGDEIGLVFPEVDAPGPADGRIRTFLLYTVAWLKDGDLNTASGDRVEPLPFHGMRRYPYGPEEAFPETPDHRRWMETYQTRRVTADRFRAGVREDLAGRR